MFVEGNATVANNAAPVTTLARIAAFAYQVHVDAWFADALACLDCEKGYLLIVPLPVLLLLPYCLGWWVCGSNGQLVFQC